MKKTLAIFSFLVAAVAVIIALPSQGRLKPYYSGDAYTYNGKVVVATANTGSLEVFVLNDKALDLAIKQSITDRFGLKQDFHDVKLDSADGRLYAYVVSGYTLYRYDISDLRNAELDKKVSNTYWEWYNRVDRFDGNIVTVSVKGVKIWNHDLEVIDAFKFDVTSPYGLRGENDSQYFLSLEDNDLKVYDRLTRTFISEIDLNFKNLDNSHRAEIDSSAGRIYVADDYYLKSFDLSGRLLTNYAHAGNAVYDTESLDQSQYVYFSNGFGVYRSPKADFKASTFTNTVNISSAGAWAMGLRAVPMGDKEYLVVFNNNSILVLDGSLKKQAQYMAVETEAEDAPETPKESLFIHPTKYWAVPGEVITVSGGGFQAGENVEVSLDKVKMSALADNQGRFSLELAIPGDMQREKRFDLAAKGLTSGLRFATSFDVK